MRHLNICALVIGGLLLTGGLAVYIRLALTRRGSLLLCFLLCMGSLLFFNLPAVVAKARAKWQKSPEPAEEKRYTPE